MLTTKEILIAARNKIEKPENWTQGVDARDSQGVASNARSQDAVCWCTIGALIASCTATDSRTLFKAVDKLEHVIDDRIVGTFNDTHTHAEVLAAFDRAIELAGEEV